MTTSQWVIVFFVDRPGHSPIVDFLGGLDARTRARFAWSIEQLRMRNTRAHEPLVRHVEDKIWELREESQTNIYRLLYCFASGRRIVILHGFQKKTQRTPRNEIVLAQQRLVKFMAGQGGE